MGVPGEKPSESDWDWPIIHPTYAPGQNRTQVTVVGGANANHILHHPDSPKTAKL